jgi:peroxiredoxin
LLLLAIPPVYLLLDGLRVLPPGLRDRPWPLALVAAAVPWMSRRRAALLLLTLVSLGALFWTTHVRYRLPPSSPEAGVGAPLPDVTVADQSGAPVRVGELRDRPLLLVWFRGSWCPYCRRQLADLAAEWRHYSPSEFRLLAISADPPEPLARLKQSLGIDFPLLSDPELKLVNHCPLAHCVAITDGRGVVRWAVISGNWEKDLPARALLQAAFRQH